MARDNISTKHNSLARGTASMGTRKEFLQHLWTGVINANLRQDGLDNLVMLFEELLMADPSGMECRPGSAEKSGL